MKVVDLSKAQRSKKRKSDVNKALTAMKAKGKKTDMTLDEMRVAILGLMEKK
ncbi:MAG: hypothetical protein JRD89_06025 [Deltaproteobacteria bacterium]|nr:hypothetical protein [Deltaproteobacteria bacterium]